MTGWLSDYHSYFYQQLVPMFGVTAKGSTFYRLITQTALQQVYGPRVRWLVHLPLRGIRDAPEKRLSKAQC